MSDENKDQQQEQDTQQQDTQQEQGGQEQGEIKTSDQLQAEVMKEKAEENGDDAQAVRQQNADNGSPEGQGVAAKPDQSLNPDYTGTMDTSGT